MFGSKIKTSISSLGYINEGGTINLTRLQAFFENLSNFDREMFEHQNNDLTYLEGKKGTNSVS